MNNSYLITASYTLFPFITRIAPCFNKQSVSEQALEYG